MDTLANVTEAELTGTSYNDDYGCTTYWSGFNWYEGNCPENWL
jgi:hypothetical protein